MYIYIYLYLSSYIYIFVFEICTYFYAQIYIYLCMYIHGCIYLYTYILYIYVYLHIQSCHVSQTQKSMTLPNLRHVHLYLVTHAYVYTHSYTRPFTHTCIYTLTQMYIHITHIHIYPHTLIPTCTYNIYRHINIHRWSCAVSTCVLTMYIYHTRAYNIYSSHTCPYTHKSVYMKTYIYTYIHLYTHTCMYTWRRVRLDLMYTRACIFVLLALRSAITCAYNMLQGVAVWGSVLQCEAVCCSVLQSVAKSNDRSWRCAPTCALTTSAPCAPILYFHKYKINPYAPVELDTYMYKVGATRSYVRL